MASFCSRDKNKNSLTWPEGFTSCTPYILLSWQTPSNFSFSCTSCAGFLLAPHAATSNYMSFAYTVIQSRANTAWPLSMAHFTPNFQGRLLGFKSRFYNLLICANLGKLLYLLCLSFLNWKVRIIVIDLIIIVLLWSNDHFQGRLFPPLSCPVNCFSNFCSQLQSHFLREASTDLSDWIQLLLYSFSRMLSLLFGMLNIGAILYLSEWFMYLFLVNILSFSLKCQL